MQLSIILARLNVERQIFPTAAAQAPAFLFEMDYVCVCKNFIYGCCLKCCIFCSVFTNVAFLFVSGLRDIFVRMRMASFGFGVMEVFVKHS